MTPGTAVAMTDLHDHRQLDCPCGYRYPLHDSTPPTANVICHHPPEDPDDDRTRPDQH